MMPFSVLRIWGLGIFSWALLGVGIYLAIEAYDEFSSTDSQPTIVDRMDGVPTSDTDANAVADAANVNRLEANDWERWALLAGAVACLGVSFGGFLPVSLLLGNSEGQQAQNIPARKTLNVDRPGGAQLHVEVYGQESRPTLLLTHGWSLDTSAWNYIKADLASRYRLVAWDLRGMGRSKGPADGDYSLDTMADDLEAVRQATETGEPVILVGHSIGGMIQQTFCRRHSAQLGTRVHGLALVHTTYTNPLRTNVAASLTTALETPLIIPLNYLTIALAPLAWLSNWQSYLNGTLHITVRVASFAGKQTRQQIDHSARLAASAWPGAVARGNLAMLKFNEEQTLPQLQVPVLVIGGDHDRMTLPSASDHIERLLPNERPIRVPSGHLGHWEYADRVEEILSEFAEHVAAGAAASQRQAVQNAPAAN